MPRSWRLSLCGRRTLKFTNLLLHHAPDQVHQKDEDEGVDQDTGLGWAAAVVLDVVTDQWQIAGQVEHHRVGDNEEQGESKSLGHL